MSDPREYYSYYTSDPPDPSQEYTPIIYYIKSPDEFGGTSTGIMDIEPILEQYKIKLISWEFSKPIENTFN